jgi:uncharacterized membrane protein YqgA involved in biofilm formation
MGKGKLMNKRFPVLSIISVLLRIAGWIVTIVSIALAVSAGLGLASAMANNANPSYYNPLDLMSVFAVSIAILWLAGTIFGVVLGLITVALGEVIGVLFAIEENTRSAAMRADSSPISQH